MRIHVILRFIAAGFILILLGLFYLQVVRGGYFFRQSVTNSIRIIPFEGRRGLILDRNGKVLAANEKSFCVSVIQQDQKDRKELFRFLARALGIDAQVLESRVARNRVASFSPVLVAQDITRLQAIVIEESAFKYPGLLVMENYRRLYPCGAAGAHVVGYVGKADEAKMRVIEEYGYSAEDPVGYTGAEEYFDDDLRAQPGGRQIQVNSRGQQVRLLSMREPAEGKTLVLTVDQDIQKAAHQALAGRKGAVVVLDPGNGEVLGMVSSPAFDPNDFSRRDDRSRAGAYLKDIASPLLNRAVGSQFPPGSVFKIPVTLAGLQERRIEPTTIFDCPGYFDLGNRRFKFHHAYGQQDLIEAMGHSANEYFFHVGLLLGPDMIARYAALFALGERTGVDVPYEVKGAIPHRSTFTHWFPGDTANMSIGQGYILTTPIQLARLMAAVESEGRLVVPHVKLSLGGVETGTSSAPERFVTLRPEVWKGVKLALHAVVKMPDGTAHVLDLPGIEVYGKTGTAQAGAGRSDHAWFAGVVKTEKRTFAFAILLEHDGSSAFACAAARDMLLDLQSQGKL